MRILIVINLNQLISFNWQMESVQMSSVQESTVKVFIEGKEVKLDGPLIPLTDPAHPINDPKNESKETLLR